MPVVCPKCHRPLTKANSWHYCKKVAIDDLLRGKPPELVIVSDKLLAQVTSWPGVSASATKSCIVFIAAKTFLVAKVMKQELDLKFVLPHETDEFPIYKRQAYGKKLEHYIRLRDAEDLDGDVIRLLRQSYELMKA
jgi:hypothetical protein